MDFKKWVKSIQTAGYNGARTVIDFICYLSYQFKMMGHKVQNSKNENHEIIDVIFGNLPAPKKEFKCIFRTHKKMGRIRKRR